MKITPGYKKAPVYRLYQFAWKSIDWLFPPRCAGCDAEGYRWCPQCDGRTKQISNQLCKKCGAPFSLNGHCERCLERTPNFDEVRSWSEFNDPLRKAILRLKYQKDYGLGDVLAVRLNEMFSDLNWKIDMVVPVPLGPVRQSERGYNQAAAIARPLSWSLELPYRPKALKRIRETVSQVGLSKSEREANVHGAFQGNIKLIAGKRVLLVDDVMTTGATLDACALALKQANALKVFGITLSRAAVTRY